MSDRNNHTERNRQVSREILAQIIECSRDIYYKYDLVSDRYEYVSPSSANVSGLTPEEIVEMGNEQILERIHPDDHEVLEQGIRTILNRQVDDDYEHTIEYRFLCKDNKYRWLSDNRTICFDENGVPISMVGNARDVTESKEMQIELAQSERKYREMFNNVRTALFRSRSEDCKMIECNQMLAEMFGYENPDQCVVDFISSRRFVDPFFCQKVMVEICNKGFIEDYQVECIRKDGSTFWASYSVHLVRDEDVLEGVAVDITNLKMLTGNEQKVLKLVIEGLTNKQIATKLRRSVRTIEDHRSSIMRKFGVHNLVELARVVLEKGLID